MCVHRCVFIHWSEPEYEIAQYRSWHPDKAVEDYFRRVQDHERHYEPVEETTWPFIRIINVSRSNNWGNQP
jgi:hypothetical protein